MENRKRTEEKEGKKEKRGKKRKKRRGEKTEVAFVFILFKYITAGADWY